MCQMTQKVSIEKIERKAPEFLIRGEYFDRSKFGRYGMGCSYLGIKSPRSMSDPIMQVPKVKNSQGKLMRQF